MPRRARKYAQSEYFHIINRGTVRSQIFYGDDDYGTFIGLLAAAVERYDLPLLSYCLMPNHWHLVAKPNDLNQLSRTMHWLTAVHTIRWRWTHERRGPGPIYQGRFKAVPVEPGAHLSRACRYVERNAFRADLAPRAEKWPWGSACQRVERRRQPRLHPEPFLQSEDWLTILNDERDDKECSAAVGRNRPIGSEAWVQARFGPSDATGRKPGRPRKAN